MKFTARIRIAYGIADLIGILLLILVSYAYYSGYGQRLYWMNTPRPPVLLPMDWEGSTMGGISIGAEEEDSTVDPNSSDITLSRVYDNNTYHTADIGQTTTWYANTQDARNAWQNPRKEISKGGLYNGLYPFLPDDMDMTTDSLLEQFYTLPIPSDISVPSSIFCYNYPYEGLNHRTCIYFGYYEHWFTQIWFGENMDRLNDKAMFDLIEKAVQIIRAAPPPK